MNMVDQILENKTCKRRLVFVSPDKKADPEVPRKRKRKAIIMV